ncbi:MAG TPA: LamG domain-containing protein [Chthoniobacterales bacterium]|nr:LamG domain-containing protein [Chthoniobacterales bacterium]
MKKLLPLAALLWLALSPASLLYALPVNNWDAGRDLARNEKPDGGAQETMNPNATVPQWSYGYREGVTGTALAHFAPAQHGNALGGQSGQEGYEGDSTAASVNTTNHDIIFNFCCGPLAPVAPGEMVLGVNASNRSAVVRWTAPMSGNYTYHADWHDIDPYGGDGAAGYVVINGQQAFGQSWANGSNHGAATTAAVALVAGDTIDFLLNPNGDISYDTTRVTFTVVTGGTPPPPPVCVPPPGGLISQYKAENNARDSSGTNHGTVNAATFVAGEVGRAFQFGENRDISIPDAASLHPSVLTVEGWINLDVLNPGHAQSIFTKAVGGVGGDSIAVWYQSGALHGATTDASASTILDYSWQPALGTWHHIAYTFNGISHALYVDGVQVATAANTRRPTYDAHAALIGADYYSDLNSGIIDFFLGRIDELSLYSRALSATEIQSIYRAGSLGKCAPPPAPAHGGLSATTLTVNGSATAHGIPASPVLSFVVQQTGHPADLAVRIQSSTSNSANATWTELPNGTAGNMAADALKTTFYLNTTGYPVQNGLYFRAISTAGAYVSSISNVVGSFDLAAMGNHIGPVGFWLKRNGWLADLTFNAIEASPPAGVVLKVQSSTNPAAESSWVSVGEMTRSTNTNYPNFFRFLLNNPPAGSGIYYRAIAHSTTAGSLDSISNLTGPYTSTADAPPTVTLQVPTGQPGSGNGQTAGAPILLSTGLKQFRVTAVTNRNLKRLALQVDEKTLFAVTDGRKNIDYATSVIGMGDHVVQALAVDDLDATARAATAAVYIRVLPDVASTATPALSAGESQSETSAVAAPVDGKTFKVVRTGGDWSTATTWADSLGHSGVPGIHDIAVIGASTVRFTTANVVAAGGVSLHGGHLVGPATLQVSGIMSISAGSCDSGLNLVIKPGGILNLINASDFRLDGTLFNQGTCNIHGAGGMLGLSNFLNIGILNWQVPLTVSPVALTNPLAGLRILDPTSMQNEGIIQGTNLSGLINQDGAGIVSHDGGGIVSHDGGGLVNPGGGKIVSHDGGGLISQDGSGLITQDGAGIVSHDGGGVISDNGLGLVAAGAGNLIAAGAGNLHQGAALQRPSSEAESSEAPTSETATAAPGYTQTGGETNLSAATIFGPVTLNGGVLSGTGVIAGNLTNNGGYITPGRSSGLVAVTGNFTQGANGALVLDNGGALPYQFDQLLVGGAASLGGDLIVHEINGYTPNAADTFNPIDYASATRSFHSISANTSVTAGPGGLLAQINPAVANPPRPALRNISTRALVETGDNVLIGGFIVVGPGPKKVIIRAIGPSLPVSGVLADPVLELHEAGGTVITNDDWRSTQQAAIIASTVAPTSNLESAIVATLQPGAHTAIVRGKGGAMGVALVEVYDFDPTGPATLANISTRGRVHEGDEVMIGGFIVQGAEPAKVLARVVGPSLTAAGVAGALADPTLDLYDRNGNAVGSNDDWRATQEAEIIASTVPPANAKEPAIVATVVPDNYTAVVRGKNNTTGVALIEVYTLH